MQTPEEKLADFYRRQSLAPEKSAAILAEGRKMAALHRRQKMMWRSLQVAAAVTLVGGLGWVASTRTQPAPLPDIVQVDGMSLTAVQDGLISFFSQPDYELDQISLDQSQLVTWLRDQGAPSFDVPPVLEGLDNLGCEVISVGPQQIYVLCFYLDGAPVDANGVTMPGKKAMMAAAGAPESADSDAESGAVMMKKPSALVHLVSVPREQFQNAPRPGDPVMMSATGQWSFATWAEGDVVYVAGSAADAERFSELSQQLISG